VNDFFGELIVPVVIRGNGQQTQPFDVLVIVKPVNDAPELHHLETNAIEFAEGEEPVPVTTNAVVYDADDEFLMGATIMVSEGYQEGADQLYFRNTDVIRGVFDTRTGTLSLTGQASLNEYQEAIRSVLYVYSLSSDTLTFIADKKLSVQLNDGKVLSERYERTVAIREQLGIDIPNAFTPNNDLSNDTWRVKPVQNSRIYHNALIRVYTKRGELVFQSRGFELEWDGKSNGVRLPADTYYYIIQTERKEYKGAVLILHE
jgi:gliding motility-associated-like protein